MTTGPPPKPTALRLLHGDRKSRINAREPVVRDAVPEAPEDMSDAVREVWDYTLNELIVMKTAAAADRDSLVCYCEAVVSHRKASAILAQSPVLIKGLHGGMVRNPALQVQRDSAMAVRAFAQEFGLTPSGRTRIQTDGPTVIEGHVNPFATRGWSIMFDYVNQKRPRPRWQRQGRCAVGFVQLSSMTASICSSVAAASPR